MPITDSHTRATRLVALEALLRQQMHRSWRTHDIAQIFGVSEDTAFRDLEELSRRGSPPLITDGTTAAFTWRVSPDAPKVLPPLRLDYAQGAALYAAARLLSQQQDEHNGAVRSSLIELISVLPEPLRPHLESIVTRLGQSSELRNVSRVFEALSQGWLSRRAVQLTYDPLRKRSFTCRFAPYLLEPSGIGHTLYFIGHSDPPDALRTYKLERIRDAVLTDETFEIPATFDGPALLARAWGVMYGDEEPVTVRLRFTQYVSKRVRETRWHPSQRLIETAEGLVWEAEIGDITEIRPWVRGWGADCEVLAPDALREELIAEVRRSARLYAITFSPTRDEMADASLLSDLFGEN